MLVSEEILSSLSKSPNTCHSAPCDVIMQQIHDRMLCDAMRPMHATVLRATDKRQ